MQRNDNRPMDGVSGLKMIGVRDLSYKQVFIACSVHCGDSRFGFSENQSADEEEQQEVDIEKAFSIQERHQVIAMQKEDSLISKLANSIGPSIHGHFDVKMGILLQLFGGI